jgi:hypothetical protein
MSVMQVLDQALDLALRQGKIRSLEDVARERSTVGIDVVTLVDNTGAEIARYCMRELEAEAEAGETLPQWRSWHYAVAGAVGAVAGGTAICLALLFYYLIFMCNPGWSSSQDSSYNKGAFCALARALNGR